ncbi:hypothetical protein CUMW_146310, partial [Citrus unshiu]
RKRLVEEDSLRDGNQIFGIIDGSCQQLSSVSSDYWFLQGALFPFLICSKLMQGPDSVPYHFLFKHCGWLRDLVPFCPGQIMMDVVLRTDSVNLGVCSVFYMVATLVQTYSIWPHFYMMCQYLVIDHSGLMFHHNQLQQLGYYSMYGHVEKLAEEIKKGASSVEGVEAKLWQLSFNEIAKFTLFVPVSFLNIPTEPVIKVIAFLLRKVLSWLAITHGSSMLIIYCCGVNGQSISAAKLSFSAAKLQRDCKVPETLPEEVLGKMSAPPKSDVPIITPNELAEADGFVFGFPTRFGMMAAQFKAFLDATGGLWRTQQLAGKPAGMFYSTGSQGGGQETTALTAITQLVHHGMIFVPIGYTFGAGMFEMEKVKGGSPYGAGTFAGDGSRQPTELELEQAFHQGKHIAGIAKKLKGSA